jgi:hypothetical protein
MSAEKILAALNEIDQSGLKRPYLDAKFAVSLSEIEETERRLGYNFPASYHSFLSLLGSGDFEATEFYGLVPNQLDLEEIPNALWLTHDLQETMDFPKGLFAFQNFDGDAVACLALANMVNGECPVVLWDHSENHERQLKKPHVLADTFGDYFYNKIRELIEDAQAVW